MEKLIEEDRLISDKQLAWLNQIKSNNELKRELNKNFLLRRILQNQNKLVFGVR